MIISVVQFRSELGDIEANIESHLRWIDRAASKRADLIVFPELSLTGYDMERANVLATPPTDERLNRLQHASDVHQLAVGVGLPTPSDAGVRISMILLVPNQSKQIYSKQILHADERPYVVPGTESLVFTLKNTRVAPAICYESLQPIHAESAHALGAEVYLASVAKSQYGIEKAQAYFPAVAKQYGMPVLLSNCIGDCDTFVGAGQTTVWNQHGIRVGQLDNKNEGMLTFDTQTRELAVEQSEEYAW